MIPNHTLKRPVDSIILDLDGTVYLGDNALPDAVETIQAMRKQGKHILFISNKPLEPRQTYAAKLTHLGIDTSPEDVLNSAYVLGQYLAKEHPELRYYVIGEERLRQELRDYGLTVVGELEDQDAFEVLQTPLIDAVIVAFDRTLSYRKLNTAYQALRAGARFFATNADKTCPMPGGAIPDAGAIITYLEYLTGRKLELLGGKPSPMMMEVALDKLGCAADRCILVGDRLETDIRMGQAAGMLTGVVLTGVSTRDDVAQMTQPPDFILETLDDLFHSVY